MLNKIAKYVGYFCIIVSALVAGISATDPDTSKDFAFDYPQYMDWTIDSIIKDIGYIPEDSNVQYLAIPSADYEYIGCWFRYDNGVEISFAFDSVITQPRMHQKRIVDPEYFMGNHISEIMIRICCGGK